MTKIGTLTCLHSNDVCARVGCLKAFMEREAFFKEYSQDTCLAAMMTCNGCKSMEKIDRLVSEDIKVMHVGVCCLIDGKKECPRITRICEMLEDRGIQVVRGTHRE